MALLELPDFAERTPAHIAVPSASQIVKRDALDTARGIPRRMEQLGAVARDGLGQCLVELLCLALEDDDRALGSGMSSVRLGHLARIERYVRKNLTNRAMTIEDIALANGISSRYLVKMLLGHIACTPTFPSTSCVISTSTATLVSI